MWVKRMSNTQNSAYQNRDTLMHDLHEIKIRGRYAQKNVVQFRLSVSGTISGGGGLGGSSFQRLQCSVSSQLHLTDVFQ